LKIQLKLIGLGKRFLDKKKSRLREARIKSSYRI